MAQLAVSMSKMDIYKMIPDVPQGGPLEVYRSKATFDWKRMKIFIEGEKNCIYTLNLCTAFLSNPEFYCDNEERSTDQLVQQNYRRFKATIKIMSGLEDRLELLKYPFQNLRMLCMIDSGLCFKRYLGFEVCSYLLHMKKGDAREEINGLATGRYHACIALTEVGHGSNLMKLETSATYDVNTQSFVLNTPSVEVWKCWSGNLGICATHAMVLAQLYTADGKCHGLHFFFVPVRDPRTMQPYPGVLLGNMGRKIGINSVDNGFLAFTNYHIPRKCLVNFVSDVTPNGQYVTAENNPRKRFALTASGLNLTRIGVVIASIICLKKGMVIAIRYAAVRKQFGPSAKAPEIPILEYPLHQSRLMPYLSASIIFDFVLESFSRDSLNLQEQLFLNSIEQVDNTTFSSLHLIIIGLKAVITWVVRDGLQEARECCGGHGYLKAAGIGDLRNDNDSILTLEGDNNILLLHISKILLSAYQTKMEGKEINMQFGLYDFLKNIDDILTTKCDLNTIATPQGICQAYNWLICYLITKCASQISQEIANGLTMFKAFSNIQTYYGKSLALAFSEFLIIRRYFDLLNTNKPPKDCSTVLLDLGILYAMWSLERHALILCEGNYISTSTGVDTIRNNIAEFCLRIKNEAVALTDAIAPHDLFLNSILGASDGEVYKRLVAHLLSDGSNMRRPSWWKEMRAQSNIPSNL